MPRLFSSRPLRSRALIVPLVLGAFALAAAIAACSSSSDDSAGVSADAGPTGRRDSTPVDPPHEGGGQPVDDGGLAPPSCEKYCTLVMAHCTGDDAQYASGEECHAFCRHLPPTEPSRAGIEKEAPTVSCRQYWADSPAKTDPKAYCLAAGPFGGNACGDRCTAFCGVLLSACTPDGGVPAYASQAECASDCAAFSYRDAGLDGGGEAPDGPTSGDTLNCRLYRLRAATRDPEACVALRPDGGACR
jgi:hypothetical protein